MNNLNLMISNFSKTLFSRLLTIKLDELKLFVINSSSFFLEHPIYNYTMLTKSADQLSLVDCAERLGQGSVANVDVALHRQSWTKNSFKFNSIQFADSSDTRYLLVQ